MATPGDLKFLYDVEKSKVFHVQRALRMGHANPNKNYLNVFPLNLAIEQGDVDMVAVLLKFGADPLLKSNPRNDRKITNGVELATAMAQNPDAKYRVEAAIILELMNDPRKLDERFDAAQERVELEQQRENALIKRIFGVGALLMLPALFYWFVFR
mmetsp:Transcript_2930/g.5723  ORF Transcript_2930/g.5723 Transcript_2930/m.5723 type:complete len:156 (+) Transcript_2930:48-515(+)